MKQDSPTWQRYLRTQILFIVEIFAVVLISLWPVGATLELISGMESRWGPRELLDGFALLSIATLVHRDRQRFFKMVGPILLLMYAGLIAAICSALLITGQADIRLGAAALGALASVGLIGLWSKRSQNRSPPLLHG